MTKCTVNEPTRIVEVEWLDSLHTSGWTKSGDMAFEEDDLNHKTVGYLLHEGEKSIAVCQSFCRYEGRFGRSLDAIMEIPKCAIQSMRFITPPPPVNPSLCDHPAADPPERDRP